MHPIPAWGRGVRGRGKNFRKNLARGIGNFNFGGGDGGVCVCVSGGGGGGCHVILK